MNKRYVKIVILCVVVVVIISSFNIVYSRYQDVFLGRSKVEIAKPIIEIESIDNSENISNGVYTNKFKVKNYNFDNKISETDLYYTLNIITVMRNMPATFKLYKINDNGSLSEVALYNNLQTQNQFRVYANSKYEQEFKLEVTYNLSGILIQNPEVVISVDATQI